MFVNRSRTTTYHYLWTPNQQDKLLADTTSTEVLWSLTDHLGTIRDVLGTTSTHLIYDAFGNLISGTNPLLFGFTGKAFDTDTNLQNNINRWYDATVGRWLSADPIGFEGNDTNLYRYVKNCLLFYLDHRGTKQSPLVRARNEKLAQIIADNNRKTTGIMDPNCEVISIVIELPDPTSDGVGHAGIGIGNEFYDFGPEDGYPIGTLSEIIQNAANPIRVPGAPFWDIKKLRMPDLPELMRDIREEEKGYEIIFVVFRISVCKSHAQEIEKYWKTLYQNIENGTAEYYIPGLHCTSAVMKSYKPDLGIAADWTFPSGLLNLVADNPIFYHTCGENKGKPAKMHIYNL